MTRPTLDALRRIDPLPPDGEPPSLVTMLERLDPAIRPLQAPLEPPHELRRRPSARVSFAGAAVAGVAVASALALGDLGGGGHVDVAAAALRATEAGPGVLHMTIVSGRTFSSDTHPVSSRREIWTAQNPRRMRVIATSSEETREDALTTTPVRALSWASSQPDVIDESVPQNVELSETSPVQTIHNLLAEGRATLTGKTTYEGREAWQLQIHPQPATGQFEGKQLPDPTLIIDAKTFAPLELTSQSPTSENGKPELAEQHERFTEYTELPANTQDEALLKLAPHPGATVTAAPER